MFRKNKALFISATIFISGDNPDNFEVNVDAANRIFDWAANGFLIVSIIYSGDYKDTDTRRKIKEKIDLAFKKYCNFKLDNLKIMCVSDLKDPDPFWDLMRKSAVNASRSLLVAETERGEELARIIDVRFEYARDFLRHM
ncbi:MAG: hypothetical protein GF349_01535 [Candidatus Magasanikbacteria bacterium]|nr:hypothetical protein [Candidatus Magasanikbacteria bacterium]